MKLTNNKSRTFTFLSFKYSFLTLLVSVACSAAHADTSSKARQLINEMSRASNELSYNGVFIYNRGQHIDTVRLIRRSEPEGVVERMISMTGPAREVIRDHEGVKCIFPENQEVMVDKIRPKNLFTTQLPEPVEKIAQYYTFTVAGEDRVAGRISWVVNVVPRDSYRYGYQLWIDQNSKLLLKSVLMDQTGRSIEQLMFTQIELMNYVPDEMLKPSLEGTNYTWHESEYDDDTSNAQSNWQVQWMPQGFDQKEHEKKTSRESNNPMDHLIYSDGLAMVSVFIEKTEPGNSLPLGPKQMGGVNAFTVSADGHQITAVGEVPRATVQQMATSVIRQKH